MGIKMNVSFRFEDLMRSWSRRSPVLSTNGIVASSQPLASYAGLKILQDGGNAADAAVACAAALNVTEPMSTGLGGDCFALFYDGKKKAVFGLNGSGRAPMSLTLDKIRADGIEGKNLPSSSAHAITVPGACAGWIDTIEKFGTMSMAQVLEPAIGLALNGHPVAPLIAVAWSTGVGKLKQSNFGHELLIDSIAPEPGQIFKNQNLGRVLKSIADHGKEIFYDGWVAEAIVKKKKKNGGVMSLDDLKTHASTTVDPITTSYRGIDVFEIPPNGQGITALIALNLLEEFDLASLEPNSAKYYHLLIESLRLAFADARYFVTDPEFYNVPIWRLLEKEYAAKRRALIDPERATLDQVHGTPMGSSDTVYLSVVDGEGNACSFINSNYMAFGTGIVPKGCGFVLQNRGCNFSLDPEHPNNLEPGKRPYHTIIPAMATKNGELWACFGNMGGFMQPQGHVQILLRMVEHDYDPQAAVDAPRFCIEGGNAGGKVILEESIQTGTQLELKEMGHPTKIASGFGRSVFGRAQIIRRDHETGVLWGGSDPRSDGCAAGF